MSKMRNRDFLVFRFPAKSSIFCRFFSLVCVAYVLKDVEGSPWHSYHPSRLHGIQKRSEEDNNIENKFNINTNTIILTVESRSVGAKYLNETDVPTNQECLVWCWETPSCNVAVFEEMTKVSCFLFDCGSPVDFRCKFTNHNFYTSSIMKTTQHSYDLNQWGKQVKHENELAVAKLQNDATSIIPPVPSVASTSSVLKLPAPTTSTSTESVSIVKTEKKCRHYQFQCFNSSECIAIYNVCDGIPQCPDGSDESVDLQCPNRVDGNGKFSPSAVHQIPTQPTYDQRVNIPAPVAVNEPQQEIRPIESHIPKKTVIPHIKPNRHEIHKQMKVSTPAENKGSAAKEINGNIPWYDGYSGNQEPNQDYDHEHHSVDGSVQSPFAHKHSKFVAANEPHMPYQNKWSDDYEQYPQQSSQHEQQYNPYGTNYQKSNEQSPKNQYSDYDRGVYDAYHPEKNTYWAGQDRVQGSNYPANEYSQKNVHAPSKQQGYPDQEDLYVPHQLPPQHESPNLFPPQLDKQAIPKPQVQHPRHQAPVSDQEGYQLTRQNKPMPHPYMAYDDPPSPDAKYQLYPEARPRLIDIQQKPISGGMYDSDDMIRENLVKQLPHLPDKPSRLYEPVAELPPPSITPRVLKPAKQNLNSSQGKNNPDVIHGQTMQKNNSKAKQNESESSKSGHSEPPHGDLPFGKMTVTELLQSKYIHSRESNNAIVALTLGLCITALLLVLVGCRLRTIRRRTARRGRTLTHDADYLVNGLYL